MTIPARANGRHRSSIHLKMLITAQLDRSGERREFDGTRRRAGNIEEELVRLGVKVHVVLRCTAVWTVIREVAVLRVLDDDLSVVGPSAKLPREGVVDCRDIRDGKSVEGLAVDHAALAMDADDLDGRMASLAGRRRGGDVRFSRGDGEFLVVLHVRQPPRVFRGRLARVDVPALGIGVPARSQSLDLRLLFRRDKQIGSLHGRSGGQWRHSAAPGGFWTEAAAVSLARAATPWDVEDSAAGPRGEFWARMAAAFTWRARRGFVRAVGATAAGGKVVRTAAGPAVGGLARTLGLLGRTGAAPVAGVSLTTCQSGTEASFSKPERSGRRSISEAMTAGSILRFWPVVVDPINSESLHVVETVV